MDIISSVRAAHQTTVIHSHRFVMELLHWHKFCELGVDKLHRPPVVALIRALIEHVILLRHLRGHFIDNSICFSADSRKKGPTKK